MIFTKIISEVFKRQKKKLCDKKVYVFEMKSNRVILSHLVCYYNKKVMKVIHDLFIMLFVN